MHATAAPVSANASAPAFIPAAAGFGMGAEQHAGRRYLGPERRTRHDWLAATLDEVDYGMLLLTDTDHVVHANHAARLELGTGHHPLSLPGGRLQAVDPQDTAALQAALTNAAQRGLRKLLSLGSGTRRVSISVVPLGDEQAGHTATTLLMRGKRQVCEALSVQGYARTHGLTAAETRVLLALCQGEQPADIAAELGVGIATVRTQIGSIRLKTGADSIRALVGQVAVLPPLMGVLRHAMTAHGAAPLNA